MFDVDGSPSASFWPALYNGPPLERLHGIWQRPDLHQFPILVAWRRQPLSVKGAMWVGVESRKQVGERILIRSGPSLLQVLGFRPTEKTRLAQRVDVSSSSKNLNGGVPSRPYRKSSRVPLFNRSALPTVSSKQYDGHASHSDTNTYRGRFRHTLKTLY